MNVLFLFLKILGSFLPKGLADLVARGFARVSYTLIYKQGLRNHCSNLKTVFPGRDEKELLAISKKAGMNLAVCLYEQLLMGRLINSRNYHKFVKDENFGNLYDAHKEGRGVILLTGHLGNYEWGASFIGYLGFKISVISVEYKTSFIRDIYEENRRRSGIGVFYVKKSFSGPVRFLKNGGLLAIAGDRNFGGSTVKAKMFGKDVQIPKGGFFLASKLGIPVVVGFGPRKKDGRYHVYLEKPFKVKEKEIEKSVEKYVGMLERYIKKYPDQWLLFEKLGK
ncbi:MAG: lysophospholipid acyltransferase family protein [candidate division WOR-3 bacterium]|jgi:lauroyl/myristoyl acyltransferase